jgi:ribonuclease P protein component
MNNTFGKKYKLCSPILIEEVFASGDQLKNYPFVARTKLVKLPKNVSLQVVFSAPKRTFRKAFQRNRIKRICKEAFRKNRHELETFLTNSDKQLALFLVYTAREEVTMEVLEQRTKKLIQKIITQLEKDD